MREQKGEFEGKIRASGEKKAAWAEPLAAFPHSPGRAGL